MIRAMGIIMLVFGSSPALGMTYFFQRDLGVENFIRYCEYTDGNVYTVESTEFCPMSVEADGIAAFGGNSSYTGFLKGEYAEGMSKICVFDVLGDSQFVRFGSLDICPLTYQFNF